ncbi:hypothetical protein H4S01_002448 [Coemansia sp. RSA 2610]|nr:hypothetical protein H4S01_002448 [Coemansia sp. RSA 2610]
MDQGHLFVSSSHPSDFQHPHNHHQPPPLMPEMSHSASNQSPTQSSDTDSPSAAATPGNNPGEIGLTLNGQPGAVGGHQQHQQQHHHQHSHNGYNDAGATPQAQQPHLPLPSTSSLHQSAYSSAFSSTAASTAPPQPPAHPNTMYQNSPQNHAASSAQYVPHDQPSALAPLQLGPLSVMGHQRPPSGFPYEFDPNDNSCRGVYSADMDPTNPAQQMPQQLTTAGYIRHGGSIPVTPGQPQSALGGAHAQHSLDMAAAAANISLPMDINGEHGAQGPPPSAHPQSALHGHNPSSTFGGSPVSNQPIFATLNFGNQHIQEYDPYNRPPKRTGRATKPKRTPRPPNAFILYRKAKQAEVIRDNPGVSNKDVSCIIGQMWKSEDPAVQDKYREQAEMEKKKHKEMHPNYKYQPRKPKHKRMQESQAAAAAVAAAAGANGLVSGAGQDGSFGGGLPTGGLSSVLKDTPASGSGFAAYQSKYHLMMQPGQGQVQPSPMHPQTPASQQQAQVPRSEEYYYRGPASLSEQQHSNGSFVGVPPQLDIKPGGFMGGISAAAAAYWTPATPSDAAFSNTLPSGNVFHSSDQAATHMRQFDTVMPPHSAAAAAAAAGHTMNSSSGPMFHSFDHQRQAQHGQAQQPPHDGHLDYQAGQSQQYHQHHSGPPQQPPHSAPTLGGYVNGSQAYHHPQQGMESLDGSGMAGSDSLGLLSPPAVAWSSNM